MAETLVHATAIALDGRGVLLRGAPGTGKSDLALRLIDRGAVLVADDQVTLSRAGAHVTMAAPAALAGKLEVRGLGIVALPAVAATLDLIVDLVAEEDVERLPEAAHDTVLDCTVPRLALTPFAASAAAKLRLAVASLADPTILAADE